MSAAFEIRDGWLVVARKLGVDDVGENGAVIELSDGMSVVASRAFTIKVRAAPVIEIDRDVVEILSDAAAGTQIMRVEMKNMDGTPFVGAVRLVMG